MSDPVDVLIIGAGASGGAIAWSLSETRMRIACLVPAYPPKQPPMAPIPLGRTGALYGRTMNGLGWHWWPSDTAMATREYEGRARCINLGHCIHGCAQGAKASTDITYWPEAIRRRVELRTRCRVREITCNPEGMATGAICFDAQGREQFQPAEVVIVACNGVGTPRLLLNSKSARFPDGLANSSGLVGKNLMFHPYALVRGYFDAEQDGHHGPHISIWSQQFYETDRSRGHVRGYTYQFNRGNGPVTTATWGTATGRIPWGEAHHRALRSTFQRHASLLGICEDLPEEHNTVTLDPVLTDTHGIPAPRIDYRLSENSRRMLEHSLARGSEIMRAAGATGVHTAAPCRSPAGT